MFGLALLCGGTLASQPTTSIPRQSEFGHKAWQAPGASLPVSGAILGEVRGVTSTPPELYMWMGSAWVSLGGAGSVGPQGPAGPAGSAATIAVGTVSTGAPGSSAIVTNAGSSSAAIFNFAIPRGDVGATGPTGPQGETGAAGEDGAQGPAGETGATGAAGAAATVAAGSTTTGLPGTSASVSNVGTSSAAIFNFTIPRGDVGATGADGEDGAPGETGPAGADGEDGATGAQGPAGDDGVPRTIQDEAVDLTQRLKVNFTGAGVTCVDNAGQTRTDCTIPGSSGIGGTVGSVDRTIPLSSGTGGSTLQGGSGWTISSAGGAATPFVTGSGNTALQINTAYNGSAKAFRLWNNGTGETTYVGSNGDWHIIEMSFTIQEGGTGKINLAAVGGDKGIALASDTDAHWSSTTGATGTPDLRIKRGGPGYLTLQDALRATPRATPVVTCGSAGTEGVIYADDSHALCYCDGTAWVNLATASGGACS